ncbi:MAG: 5-formyltetrahydrofolate cyclo-ligase [Chromatiaceae bacterium]|nr:MAG: 5-formyltetrahydrofolate cyclo-ligase [Chromatiaceae bacterium]
MAPNQPPLRLRRDLRAARRALSPRQQRQHAAAVARHLGRNPRLRRVRRIALYLPADGEVDPGPLRERLARPVRRWYLPVLRQHPRGRLWFVRQRRGERLRRNRFGIPEPLRRSGAILPGHALDLVLVPLVGFDGRCNRLGMGGGFYDRSLAFRRWRRHWQRPLLIGLAHECQRVAQIAARPWDVPVDAVVTELGLQWCARPADPDG